MAKHYEFDEDFETEEILDRVSNGEDSDYFVRKKDGIYCSDGTFICDMDMCYCICIESYFTEIQISDSSV